jgi:hypothetical protein
MCQSAPIKDKQFFHGGKAIFTIEPSPEFVAKHGDCQPRYTFKIVHRDGNDRYQPCEMVLLLTGPDNTSDYTYMGILDDRANVVRITQKSCVGEQAWPKRILDRVLQRAAADQLEVIQEAGWKLMHEGRCCRCGRLLTVPSSIEAGIGPECAGRVAEKLGK